MLDDGVSVGDLAETGVRLAEPTAASSEGLYFGALM